MSEERKVKRTFTEQVEIAGSQLVERVKELLQESNARRVIIKNTEGEELITLPLTFGVVAGGLITVAAPLLAAVGALAALVTRVRLEIVREEEVTEEVPEAAATSDKPESPPPTA
jgi:hypothetical protein